MKIQNYFKYAFYMVFHSKLRSWLTIIGIIIGVGSVISIMSLGQGIESSMGDMIGDMGSDLISITPGFSKAFGSFGGGGKPPGDFGGMDSTSSEEDPVLGKSDVLALKTIPEIEYIDTQITGKVDVYYLGKEGSVSLTGVDQKTWPFMTSAELQEGRLFSQGDYNVVIIGGRLAEDFFDKPVNLNSMITIEGSSFRVIGILDDISTSIYMPIKAAYGVLEDSELNKYDSILVSVDDSSDYEDVVEKITTKLLLSRHVNEDDQDFSVSSGAEIVEQRQEMMGTLTSLLTAMAAISLLVGSIGVANTMFTSILEKREEIGIMKAIGAKNEDILSIFLLNSGIIGLVGGILGILLGILLSNFLPLLMSGTPFSDSLVTFDLMLFALSISFGVGIVSGFIPAYQASKLKPVDILRGN